jgi:hypothetical protein
VIRWSLPGVCARFGLRLFAGLQAARPAIRSADATAEATMNAIDFAD